MRISQILMAVAIIAFAISVMVQGFQVGAKWEDGQAGPGFFPFWLAAILGICGVIVLVQSLRGSQAAKFFHDRTGLTSVLKVTGTATGLLILTYVVGFRLASIAYLFVYLRFIGKHRWPAVIAMSLLIPIGGYLLFERVLLIGLPRGIVNVDIPFLD
jgi:putative tricarboxylic transport membrane protein